MYIHDTCKSAIQDCLKTKSFAIAKLYNDEKTMSIHIHDCYKVYFSISGGQQFLIDNRVYDFEPGDIFFINQFESHYLSKIDQMAHERIVISIFPEYLKRVSTLQTDLNYCFTYRSAALGHKITLTENEQRRFQYYIHKLSEVQEFGQDVLDQAAFLELMTYLNRVFVSRCAQVQNAARNSVRNAPRTHREQVDGILSYVNQHLAEDLTVPTLAAQFYLSDSYMSRIFKEETGTTVSRYITAKRISRAKELLANGHSVAETSNLCWFRDYSNFLKSFTKIVGISPKKYSIFALDSQWVSET